MSKQILASRLGSCSSSSSNTSNGIFGIIELNNLSSLNALSLDMIYTLQNIYKDWYNTNTNNSIKLILIKSATATATTTTTDSGTTCTTTTTTSSSSSSSSNNIEQQQQPKTPRKQLPKVFCAGGDVKQVYYNGLQNPINGIEFFKQEYYVNYMLSTMAYNNNNNNNNNNFYSNDKSKSKSNNDKNNNNNNNNNNNTFINHIALLDGIVMGGGVGISIWNQYRIITENTIWSMPETSIGLFPDVGSMYWLSRSLRRPLNTTFNNTTKEVTNTSTSNNTIQSYPSNTSLAFATFLLLTGYRLSNPIDLLATGIGTHYIQSNQLQLLQNDLVQFCNDYCTNNSTNSSDNINTDHYFHATIQHIITSYHEKNIQLIQNNNQPTILQQHSDFIESKFSPTGTTSTASTTNAEQEERMMRIQQQQQKQFTMEEIILRLQEIKHQHTFYESIYNTIQSMSPTSCKVTLEALYQSKYSNQSIYANLQMEYRIACHFITNNGIVNTGHKSDFYTGIQSKLIDKVKTIPQWYPSTFEAVTTDMVQSYFAPIDDEWTVPLEFQLNKRDDTTTTSSSPAKL